ncbi:MAG TPA: hypothetical protein DCL51_05910 [Ruthenibacterium lactatiformans]|nr:hypothetical protein [Ruthenibacterium lactatiformans]
MRNKMKLLPMMAYRGVKQNRLVYRPYLLACFFSVFSYYLFSSLLHNDLMERLPKAAYAWMMLSIGKWLLSVILLLFLLYAGSFLQKRRKRELGLYSLLGLERKHIGILLFWENAGMYLVSVSAGIILGFVLNKLMFLLLLRMSRMQVDVAFYFSIEAVVETLRYFAVVFLCIYIKSLWGLYRMKPVELMSESRKGEKEVKRVWLWSVIGGILLVCGYYISVTSKLDSMIFTDFFLAVFLVVFGTYFLFTSGSVAFLQFLKKRKNIYYRPSNQITISGMLYRMKQNAAGLAAICILSTMVLVTISTTVSLYMGRNDMVTSMYPREICSNSTAAENAPAVQDAFAQSTRALGLEIKNPIAGRSRSLNVISVDGSYEDAPASVSSGEVVAVSLVPLSDYNSTFGTNFQLASGEALAYPTGNFVLSDTVTLGGQAVHIAQRLDESPYIGSGNYTAITGLILVVPDEEATSLYRAMGGTQEQFAYSAAFDVDATPEQIAALQEDLWTRLNGICGIYARSELYTEWNAMYGSFLFLGIFLGCLFLMATVLIIYYKQISEGYEDHDRFRIMQQVGMSRKEVKRAINKQILLVFFLPLLMAALHMVFAFEIICNMLLVFGMVNRLLFFGCTAVTFLIFAAAYVVVYRITARTYYRLVEA